MTTFFCLHCRTSLTIPKTRSSAAAAMSHYSDQHGEIIAGLDPDVLTRRMSRALDDEAEQIVHLVATTDQDN